MANIRLVPKFYGNVLKIGYRLPNDDLELIAIICMPNDRQINDDIKCCDEIMASLKRRIRRSV